MIRHICMFKLKEENKAADLMKFCERAKALEAIGEVRRFEVVCNGGDMPQSNYDAALIFDFDDKDALDRYQNHPVHKAFGAFVTGIREDRACIDYYFEG